MEAKKKFVINTAFYAIIVAIILVIYQYVLPILTPFLIGFVVASLVQLPLRKLSPKHPKHHRLLSNILCVVFYVAIVWLLVLFGAKIVREVSALAAALPGLFENTLLPFFVKMGDRLEAALAPIDPNLVSWVIEMGETAIQQLGKLATDLSAWAVKLVANGAVGVPGLIIQIILTVVATFYIANDYTAILEFFKNLIPQSKRHITLQTLDYAKTAVVAYIKSYSIIFFVTFMELCIGLAILGIPYAVAIALGIALFDLMPVLGTGGILLPWALILVFMDNLPLALGILILYVVITVVRNILEPRIVGNQIGLHPLATLMAMILGLNLMGLPGMLFFPITLVAIAHMRKSTQKNVTE